MAAKQLKGHQSQKTGFTLIELLIVSGLSTMLLLTLSAMFMTFLASSTNTNIRRILNREGGHALNQIEFLLRNARQVSCASNTVSIVSLDRGQTVLSFSGDSIASTSANTANLTSNAVRVNSGTFSCANAGDKLFVDVEFELQKLNSNNATVGLPETYTTSIQVRN